MNDTTAQFGHVVTDQAPEEKTSVSPSAFYTREAASKGIRLQLKYPNGNESGEWIAVRSRLSDEVDSALDTYRRSRDSQTEPGVKIQYSNRQLMMPVRVAMVSGWSFAEPCTPENIENFLRNAPQLAEQIDAMSWDNAKHFG